MEHPHQYHQYEGNRSAFLFHELLRQEMPDGRGRKSFKKGESIFEEGKHANGLYCILSGKVKITRMGDGGKEQIVRLAASRDVIGYRALLAGESYKASAIALEDTTVGFVPKKTFYDILQSSPEISMGMMKLLSQDLEQSETKRVDIATKTVKERLAEVLLLLKETYGTTIPDNNLNINISRDELAAMVGSATEVAIRQLAKFKEEGLIETKGRHIRIIDADGLLKVSRLHD